MSTAVGESFAATAPPALPSKSIGSSSRPPRRAAQFHERHSSMSGSLLPCARNTVGTADGPCALQKCPKGLRLGGHADVSAEPGTFSVQSADGQFRTPGFLLKDSES